MILGTTRIHFRSYAQHPPAKLCPFNLTFLLVNPFLVTEAPRVGCRRKWHLCHFNQCLHVRSLPPNTLLCTRANLTSRLLPLPTQTLCYFPWGRCFCLPTSPICPLLSASQWGWHKSHTHPQSPLLTKGTPGPHLLQPPHPFTPLPTDPAPSRSLLPQWLQCPPHHTAPTCLAPIPTAPAPSGSNHLSTNLLPVVPPQAPQQWLWKVGGPSWQPHTHSISLSNNPLRLSNAPLPPQPPLQWPWCCPGSPPPP